MKSGLIVAVLVVLQACEAPEPPTELIQPEFGTCQAEAIAPFVGQSISALQGVRFSHTIRVIDAGDPVTMDYSADRSNFVVGDNQTIIEAYCG